MLSVARFNAQLARQGQQLAWSKAAVCPCRDAASGSPKPGCPVCRAKGYLWAAAVPSHAGVAGMKVQREWERMGEYEGGDVVVSIPSDTPMYAAGERDRVVFVQSSESFDVAHVRDRAHRLRQHRCDRGHDGEVHGAHPARADRQRLA